MKIDTPTLKNIVNHRVRYKLKGSEIWAYDILLEVYRKNLIFEGDSRHFSDIKEIEIV